jgi:asparaginyl-tRNA synthetase
MDLAESFLTHIVTRVLETHRPDLKLIGKDITKLEAVIAAPEDQDTQSPGAPRLASETWEATMAAASTSPAGHAEGSKTPRSGFPRLTYDEAHAMLLDAHARGLIDTAHVYGDDFGSPDETYISSQFSKPVMVHRYPAAVKAFYMQPDPLDPTKALCVDVLAPEGYGEIIGGSQRVDDYDLLKSRIEAHNLPLAAFQWYLDLRKYGSVPHSGFGMGIERCVAWICGLEHVRETIPFPRTLNRIYP